LAAACCFPESSSGEQVRALVTECVRDALLDRWPNLKLGLLDGRSPLEAAADPGSRPRLMGAVIVLETIWEDSPWAFDFAALRSRLGLPAGPIDLHGEALATLPAMRLERLAADALSDADLSLVLDRALDFAIRSAERKFAQAIVDRPTFANSDERLLALTTMAQTATDVSEALRYCDEGRRASEAKGRSNANWDLIELSFRIAERNGPETARLIDHLQRQHVEEPGVADGLASLLVQSGLLRPDGTPAMGPEAAEPAMAAAEPSSEPSQLWTPESAQPGGGKLWTPG
jgi:hypothetical protein